MSGRTRDGQVVTVEIAAPGSPARNDAFDVTPARLITGLITERGVCRGLARGPAVALSRAGLISTPVPATVCCKTLRPVNLR